MSDLRSRPLRHALKQVAVTGTTGSLLLGASVFALAAPGAPVTAAPSTTSATSTTSTTSTTTAPARAAAVTIHTRHVASKSKKKRVNVPRMMKTAASLKGRPYRYGAAGPRAFDCSGYTLYVLKKQGIKIPRTAAQQYTRTKHVSKKRARVGDFVFFYGRGGIYHVGILAGKGKMWASPRSGAHVRLQKIWGSNWKVGRLA